MSNDMGRPGASINGVWKATALYMAFGAAHAVVMIVYCTYRAQRGNPSDLPCVSWLWTPMEVVGWPYFAIAFVVNPHHLFVPSLLVMAVEAAFLGGFIATFAWLLLRNPRRSSP